VAEGLAAAKATKHAIVVMNDYKRQKKIN